MGDNPHHQTSEDKTSLFLKNIWPLLLLFGVMFGVQHWISSPSVPQLPYSAFKTALHHGHIQKVQIGNKLIHGTHLIPREQPPSRTPDAAGSMTSVRFNTIRVDDPDLIRDLESHQVPYTGQQEGRGFATLLVWLLPVALIVGLWSLMAHRMKGTTQGLMSFGKSRARIYAAAAEHHRAQELARALSDLQQLQAQLLQSEKLAALGRLSADIAHELNSPLQGLLMLLSVYLARVSPGSREADQLAKMRAACEHMAAIVADLTAFARPASEDMSALDLREVVQTTLGFSAVHLRHQDIRVTTHIAEPLPPVYGNKSQLQQVLLNLLQNASDAIQGTGEIVIRAAAALPEVLVQVSDSGVGMAPEHLAHIFEPFFTTKVPGQGTGLGLAVSLGIVETHGGTISVESTPEVGTTVSVRLPVAPPEPAAEGAPVCPPPPAS